MPTPEQLRVCRTCSTSNASARPDNSAAASLKLAELHSMCSLINALYMRTTKLPSCSVSQEDMEEHTVNSTSSGQCPRPGGDSQLFEGDLNDVVAEKRVGVHIHPCWPQIEDKRLLRVVWPSFRDEAAGCL